MSSVIRYVFVPALIAGLFLGCGIPGVEDILYMLWETVTKTILPMIPKDMRLQFLSLGIVIAILVLIAKIEPFLNALEYGGAAILSAILTFIGGIFLVKLSIIGVVLVFIGFIFATLAE